MIKKNSKTMRNRMMMISFLLMILTIVIFMIIAKKTYVKDCIDHENSLKKIEYNGIISGKYENINKHYLPTLEIKEENRIKLFESFNDLSGVYEYVQVGDSIIKDSGSLKIKIFRNNEENTFFLDLNCR